MSEFRPIIILYKSNSLVAFCARNYITLHINYEPSGIVYNYCRLCGTYNIQPLEHFKKDITSRHELVREIVNWCRDVVVPYKHVHITKYPEIRVRFPTNMIWVEGERFPLCVK